MASHASASSAPSTGGPRPLRRIARSFGFAFAGLAAVLRTTPNFWVHLGAALLAVAVSVLLRLSPGELALVILAIGLVLVVEAFNTALEALADVASPEYHPLIKRAKDISAAAVLISALTAVVVAAVLFLPRLR
ncbi:MAG: diacylglycerol kinase family protein [Chloroflexota bacterium]|nr:diacylglycerol kinase family protein [Chloroflexota bacterium]